MIWNALQLALREIRRNLMRSFLTILGIVIGVSAVITMVTLGNGATRAVSDQIASLGSNLLIVRPGQMLGPGRDSAGAPRFKVADADALRSQVSGLAAAVPVASKAVTLVAMARNWSSSVTGTTTDWFAAGKWQIAAGRVFNEPEERAGAAVCVIGETIRRELFGGLDPIGQPLRVKQFSCEVIGLLASKGQSTMGSDQDDIVVVPLRTLQRRLTGSTDVATLMISVKDEASMDVAKNQVTWLMREPCTCGRTTVRIHRLLGRTDDMMIIRGVNVFPSQIENVLVRIDGAQPHYRIIIDRGATHLDEIEIQVEVDESVLSDVTRAMEQLRKRIHDELRSELGISAHIKLVEPRSIERSEGKAKRIIDKRTI